MTISAIDTQYSPSLESPWQRCIPDNEQSAPMEPAHSASIELSRKVLCKLLRDNSIPIQREQQAIAASLVSRKLTELETRVATLENQSRVIVPVAYLPPPFHVRKHFFINLEQHGDDWLASWFDAGIFASGEHESDALANLKDIITAKYAIYERHSAAALGRSAAEQWMVLAAHISKR